MKLNCLLFVSLIMAGCSSAPVGQNAAANPPAKTVSSQNVQYHHEVTSEFSDGETKFLKLTPDSNP